MSTTPAEGSQTPYWQLPATKWDAVKFVVPMLTVAVWAIIQLWFSDQAKGQVLLKHDVAIAGFAQAKEERGGRTLVLEREVVLLRKEIEDLRKQIEDGRKESAETQRDIKLLLRLVGQQEGKH